MPRIYLHAPKNFRNLCMLSRTLEVFGYDECTLFDPHRLIRERYGKSRTREMRVVSAGAFQKVRWQTVADPAAFLDAHSGTSVATVMHADATPLPAHCFTQSDLVLFGSEAQGLPDSLVSRVTHRVTIPARGRTQSLNLAVALAIVLFEADRQLSEPLSRAEA
jgi:tRNA G18 (ribose-2'-O)-methylase SpoU